MRFTLSVLCTLLLAVTAASALSTHECYQATRSIIVPILTGDYDEMGPTTVEKPGGWDNWVTVHYQGPGDFKGFKIIEIDADRKGCWASVRFNKLGGNVYALFVEFDKSGHMTKLTSVRELLERRQEQLQGTLESLGTVLPSREMGEIDDLELLESLREIARTARQSRDEIKKYIAVLENAFIKVESGRQIKE